MFLKAEAGKSHHPAPTDESYSPAFKPTAPSFSSAALISPGAGRRELFSSSSSSSPSALRLPMAGSDEPLSLNEKNERLLRDLSRSRPRPSAAASPGRTEIRVRKVRLEGRRRLCKLSSGSAAEEAADEEKCLDSSPDGKDGGVKECLDSPLEEKTGEDCTDSIRDILDDLSSRMESLSMQKPAARPKPVRCDPVDCKITTSPLALSPDQKEQGKGRAEVKGKAAAHSLSDEEGEDSCTILDGKRQPKGGGNQDGASIDILDDSVCGLSAAGSIRMAGTGASRSVEYVLSGNIVTMLYPHQRDGLRWLWALHCGGTGGILGDDMGLGKTMQVCAFLAGLFYSHLIKRALIVAPKTLHAHWMKELSVVGLGEKIRDYSGVCTKTRQYELQSILKEGGVLLTTYDIVRNNSKSIRGDWYVGDQSEEEIIWDYIILDEGHIIKNPKTQRAKSLHEIPSAHRIIISGTPIQNNLKELWALFNFCCPEILGDKDMFKTRYENPILRGNDKNASDREKHVGSSVAKELRERIKPYFLRRLKSEVFFEDDATSNRLSKKNEIIVWLKLTSCQRRLYEAFLNSELVHASINGSPLAALTILKKICDHPMLLTKKAAEGVLEGMDNVLNREEVGMVEEMAKNLANLAQYGDFQQVDQNVSCKICFIMSLLENLVEEGHIILIFSQTRKMLNLIQEAMFSEGYKFLRIDGTTKVSEREKIVKDFQEGSGAPIFLLTSQVGGLGLTLTKADRVIVVDPAWNPSTDNQSVDRAYRIGQTKDVLVYRLMTCGTIEEKIYKMQVFKGGLFKSATEHKEQTRYFSQKDISELFSLPEQGFDVSLTQQQLHVEHDQQHTMDDALVNHLKFLKKQDIAGISHHSLLFSKTATVKFVQENNEGQSKMGNRIAIRSSSVSSSERVVNGVEYAFKPNDEKFSSKTNPARTLTIEAKNSPENIEDRIKRLSQTLANKALISKLPDRGDKLKRQISELNAQLREVRGAYKSKQPEVIDLDGLTEDLQRVLTV